MIHVLEDMDVRVQWLTRMFPDAAIRWSTTVDDFLESLRGAPASLVILDHDLGPGSVTSEDTGGKTGYDAAWDLVTTAPILIWSINGYGAQNMQNVLRNRGMEAHHIPFMEIHFTRIAAFVARALMSWEAKG